MVTYRCGSGRERAPKEPSASDVCADVRTIACGLTIRFRMPAKIGPKRDRALARAGCYFDGSAATCGVRCVLDLRESDDCVRAIAMCVLAYQALRRGLSTSLRAKRSNPSFRRGDRWIASLRSQGRWIQFRNRMTMSREVAASLCPPYDCSICSPALANVNIDVEIDVAHAGLRRLMRAAFMPAALARAGVADISQLQASPLRQRP